MTPNLFKITFHKAYPGGFSSVLITQQNGREDFWMLSDGVIVALMARQNGLDINSITS